MSKPIKDEYLDYQSIKAGWKPLFEAFFASAVGQSLIQKIRLEIDAGKTLYPADPFRLFRQLDISEAKVIIVGQDPYHGENQAAGLAFHVNDGVKVPPSLKNIFKELASEFDSPIPTSGDLTGWVAQGVFLLNAVLTVRKSEAASHAGFGWETLTDTVLSALSSDARPKVFMLWGHFARSKAPLIDTNRHLVLVANHPSPFSAYKGTEPFFGCEHFKKANLWLTERGLTSINWAKTRA